MPWESKKQQRWGHSPAGKKALTNDEIKEFDDSTNFDAIPEEATSGDGKKFDVGKAIRKTSRDTDPHKGKRRGGFHGPPKGKKGYTRKEKHKSQSTGSPLTPVDETYRGIGLPVAEEMNWNSPATGDEGTIPVVDTPGFPPTKEGSPDKGEETTPVVDTPGFPPTREGQGKRPDKGAPWGASVAGEHRMTRLAAELNWSTHKAETFKDTGEKGLHPAWGLKSIIDRGVKTHEKSEGDKRIGEAENSTQTRDIKSKSFKSYSMVHAFNWTITDNGDEEWIRTRYPVHGKDLPFPGAASPFGSKDEDDETETEESDE